MIPEYLTKPEKQALRNLKKRLKSRFGDSFIELKMFGSKARGDYVAESDIDVFLLLGKMDDATRDYLAEVASELNLKYDVVLSIVAYEKESFDQPVIQFTPFVRSILKQGISL